MSENEQRLEDDSAARVLVAGAGGYAGALATELVWRHPHLELARATARSDVGTRLRDLYPRYSADVELSELDLAALEGIDAALVAYPHGASAPVVAELRGMGIKVVDLSADFRLRDVPSYERWYGPHGAPELIEDAVYGLPELYRREIAEAELVANPGCYPTATVLALAPLAAAGLIEDAVVDAKSGVSGAGRAASGEMQELKEADDARPYKVDGHRHSPEITQQLSDLGSNDTALVFVPHLLPFDQGELVSCYVGLSGEVTDGELATLYRDRYADEEFVEVLDSPPGVSAVRGTNRCQVHPVAAANGRAMVFATIDNLWKGAASQAIQNLNLMLGLPEAEGIS